MRPAHSNQILSTQQSACREILARLAKSSRVVAFTGAGISKESGIPTFRERGGLWENYRVEDVATSEAFQRDPELVWKFYLSRRKDALKAQPNAAHLRIAEWGKQLPFVGVVTQNIDGLHARAGSVQIQELHGNLWKVRCTSCEVTQEDRTTEFSGLPHCRACNGLLRPHIVWFGETLDLMTIQTSLEWMRTADLIFVVGTSGVVEPAAGFVRDAKLHGVFVVEVNPEETALTSVANVSLFGRAGKIFGEWFKLTEGAS